MSITFPFKITAIKIKQPFGEFFLTSIPAEVLLTVTYPDPLRIKEKAPKAGRYPLTGTQRADSISRLAEIGRFIDTVEAVFPTPIILAANYRQEDGEIEDNEGKRWKLTHKGDNLYEIEIPSATKLASIVDGQHRLLGFERAAIEDRQKMDLACSIFFDLPNPYQAYIFATVNFNQKKVDRSLAFELFGFDTEQEEPQSWTPDKTAVFLCRKLNTDPDSAFYKHIIVTAKDDNLLFPAGEDPSWFVSTACVVEGIMKLFSKAPKLDRAAMFAKETAFRKRSDLGDDNQPLRTLFRETNDLAIYEMVKNYFAAVDEFFWSKLAGNSLTKKTVGIQAFFDVLLVLSKEAVEQKDISKNFFSLRLKPASEIDFTDPFFSSTTTGRTRLKNSLLFAMGLILEQDLKEQDRADYKRVVE